MTEQTLLTIFIALTTVAIVIQVVILFALYKAVERSSARMESIAGRLEERAGPVLATAQAILDDAQPKIGEITSNMAETSATIRAHASEIAGATGEILQRVRSQAVRIDELINNTANKVEQTTDMLQNTVVSPVRRIHAMVQAVNAGLGFLKRAREQRKATQPGKNTADEEMFI